MKEDLAENKYNRIKLHCTLLNSKRLADMNEGRNRSQRKDRTKYSFDASAFLKKYEKFKFGNVNIDRVYLNDFGPSGNTPDGYYNTIDYVDFVYE